MTEKNSSTSPKLYPSPELLKEGPVQAEWEENAYWQEPQVKVSFPEVSPKEAGFSGLLHTNPDGKKVMKAGTIVVPEELEGHHLGEKLLRALTYEAVSHGCEEIEVDFRHPASLKASLKIFGYERIHFADAGKESPDFPTDEQGVMQYLVERWNDWDQNRRPHQRPDQRVANASTMDATIDLADLDISQWEAPLVEAQPIQAE